MTTAKSSSNLSLTEQQHLSQRWAELQEPLLTFNERVEALQHDIALTLDGERRVVLEKRLVDAKKQRQTILAELATIEEQIAGMIDPTTLSEDGQFITDKTVFSPPLPEFSPHFLATLEPPQGVVKLRDKLYVKREADALLNSLIVHQGTTVVIQAPRQTGKTSLLTRGCYHAKAHGANIVKLTFQLLSQQQLETESKFIKGVAANICDELGLDITKINQLWIDELGALANLTRFMKQYILPACTGTLILALDEVDNLRQTPFATNFFGLLRAWHDFRGDTPTIWEKLNIILVISTETHLLIDSVSQSPFNVATQLNLKDFTEAQVQHLNQQHGTPLNDAELTELIALTAGHPYLTRLALYTVANQHLNWPTIKQTATADDGIFGSHLRYYYQIIRQYPTLQQALKQIIQNNRCKQEEDCLRLEQAGLLKKQDKHFIYRCELYKRYFMEKLI